MMNSIVIEQINENVKDGILPYTISIESISHFRPHITNRVWDGSLVYLKGNPKAIRTSIDYTMLNLQTKTAFEITSMISMLPHDKREEVKTFVGNLLKDS